MAKDKRSFLLYSDIHFTVSKLTDDQAGKLFKHILSYVNDENPVIDDLIIEVAFEPIKQSLKRDLRKYEEIREKRSMAGKVSADKRQQVLTSVDTCQQDSTHSTVNDNVIVSDIDNESKFKSEVWLHTDKYPESLLTAFLNYWTEKNKKGKMRYQSEKYFEVPRRLATWASRDKTFRSEPEPTILKIKTGAFSR